MATRLASSTDQFRERLAFGQVGEGLISRWLRRKLHCIVLPAYEIEKDNKGPRLFMPDNTQLITPDLLAISQQQIVQWIEAKHKSVFTWHRKSQQWVTGIDQKHYKHYLEVNRATPWKVWLMFLHSEDSCPDKNDPYPCPTGLFGNALEYLRQNENHRWGQYGNGGMVYWSHDKLQKLASISEVLWYAKQ